MTLEAYSRDGKRNVTFPTPHIMNYIAVMTICLGRTAYQRFTSLQFQINDFFGR